MSLLKDAVLRAQQRGPAIPQQGNVADANPSPWQANLTAGTLNIGNGQLTHFQQLSTLRRKFDACIKGTTRFEDGLDVSRWGVVSGRVRRQQNTAQSDTSRKQRGGKAGHSETWPADLEADLEAVALEAGLVNPAVHAVLRAAQRGTISSNPGLLLCQLLRFQACLEGLLGRRQVLATLRSHPALLNASPDELAWHMEELQEIFGASTAASMVAKQPMLLCACPFKVWSNLEALRSMLCIRMDRAQHIASRQPRLLLNSPSALRGRLSDLADLTELPTDILQGLISSQPALLTYHPATLADNLERMADLLALTTTEAGHLVCKAPTLLMLHHATLANKLQGLSQVLQCDCSGAIALVRRQPSLLSMSTQLIADKCQRLPELLSAAPQDVALVVAAQPSLLTISSTTLQRKLQALQDTVNSIAEPAVRVQHSSNKQHMQHPAQLQADQVAGRGAQDIGHPQMEVCQCFSHPHLRVCTSSVCSSPGPEVGSTQQEAVHNIVLRPPETSGSPAATIMDNLYPGCQPVTCTVQGSCMSTGKAGLQINRSKAAGVVEVQVASQVPDSRTCTCAKEGDRGGSARTCVVCAAAVQPGALSAMPASIGGRQCTEVLDAARQQPCYVGTLAVVMGRAWHQQLSTSKPHVRATYACFSEQRYARLPHAAAVVVAAASCCGQHEEAAWLKVVARVQQVAGKQWALSRLLRVSDATFEEMLCGAVDLVQGAAL